MKVYFKEGDEIAHKENLEHKMYVARILKVRVPSKELDKEGNFNGKYYSRIEGVECHWWMNNDLKTAKFHTRELVPFDIAKEGKEKVKEWIEKNN